MTFSYTENGWRYFYCGINIPAECTESFRLGYCKAGMGSCSCCPVNIKFNQPFKDDIIPGKRILKIVSGTFVLLMNEESCCGLF